MLKKKLFTALSNTIVYCSPESCTDKSDITDKLRESQTNSYSIFTHNHLTQISKTILSMLLETASLQAYFKNQPDPCSLKRSSAKLMQTMWTHLITYMLAKLYPETACCYWGRAHLSNIKHNKSLKFNRVLKICVKLYQVTNRMLT